MGFAAFWQRFRATGYGPIGLAMLVGLLAVAIFAPDIAPFSPTALGDDLMQPPSAVHWFGTDHLGRDVFSGVVWGVRVSLLVGVTAAAISGIVGTVLGAIAGYVGGVVDEVISKLIDIFLMIPAFFLVIIVVAMWGNSLVYLMVIIGLTNWPANARLMRAQALSLKQRTFTRAAVALGDSHGRILLRHIMPHGLFPIIANTTLQVAAAVLTEASLSFIGLGDPNVVSWGKMIFDGRSVMQLAWWSTVFPGLAVVVTVMAFYFLGDGLNVALNPKLQGRAAS